MNDNYCLYRTMLLIRRFEEKLLDEFESGKLAGTTHTYIGQEADAAGIFSSLDRNDIVFSNHRCHGHFLAYGGDPYGLAAELLGKATGIVGGRGGSQHIQWRNFYSNGIQGGTIPVTAGMALAEKKRKSGHIAIVFIGDGTLGEGILYETLNIASLWSLPILFIVEDNGYAQTTPKRMGVAGSMGGRFTAFDIPIWERDTMDVLEVKDAAKIAIDHIRQNCCPGALILHTYRFSAHSKGDDLRDPQEIASARERDPLKIHGKRLAQEDLELAETEVGALITGAFARASTDPVPSLSSTDIFELFG